MKHIMFLRLSLMCALGLPLCYASEAGEKRKAAIVQPCESYARSAPITRECVAAAIAKEAFLRETRHQISRYTMLAMQHSAAQWKFIIEGGDETRPPADGAQWMVFVDRATGKVELIPGR